MADLRQVVFSQTGHFHDGITVNAILQHGAGNCQLAFITTCLPSWMPFWMPFCSSCCAMVISASPCCGTRCASSRTKASASDVSPAWESVKT